MNKVIVLSSITYALKARDILKENGIYSKIVRSRAVKNIRGCGHGVSFDIALADAAKRIIESAGIPILGSVDEK